jgi:hypothetical protein
MKTINVLSDLRKFNALIGKNEHVLSEEILTIPYRAIGGLLQETLLMVKNYNKFVYYNKQKAFDQKQIIVRFTIKPNTTILDNVNL